MSYRKGEAIRFPDPHDDDRMTDGTFLNTADEPLPMPSGRIQDAAWVRRADGTAADVCVPYASLRPIG